MRHAIPFLTMAALLASSTAFAGPHGMGGRGGMGGIGGMGGMGGMGANSHAMTMPMASQPATPVMAGNHPKTPLGTGQKSQSCQAAANYPADTPGNSYNAPGSAFNPNGTAGTRYAGQQPQNSRNPKSVAQYDIACSNQAAH